MKPDGTLVMTMPNPHWSRSRIHHALHGTLANFTQHDLDWNHHVFTPLRHVSGPPAPGVELEGRALRQHGNEAPWPKARLSLSYPLMCAEAAGKKAVGADGQRGLRYELASVIARPVDGAATAS